MGRTARQRIASRRNLAKARRVRSHDTIGHWVRIGIRAIANAPTRGKAGTVSNFIEGKHRKKSNRWYKDRSGKRARRKK